MKRSDYIQGEKAKIAVGFCPVCGKKLSPPHTHCSIECGEVDMKETGDKWVMRQSNEKK